MIPDFTTIRQDFPILQKTIDGKPLVYLDSTATSLKPQVVIDAMDEYYSQYSANIFRGIYTISERATQMYEDVRETVKSFIHAPSAKEIVFVRNTTEALNLIASSLLLPTLTSSDSVVSTLMEHHANFVPWQQMCKRTGAKFMWLSITPDYQLDLEELETKITRATKLFAFTATSNVLGTITPIKKIVQMVKRINPECVVVVDAAQAAAHIVADVVDWGADAVAFSGHKMLGPTGFGVLWAKQELLERLMPYQYGGEMIREVTLERTTFQDAPHKFEAGTPAIAEVIGGGRAIEYLMNIGMENIRNHEKELVTYAFQKLSQLKNITTYGPQNIEQKAGIIAFTMKGIHAHDIAQVLNEDNICIRAGHHCAMPLHAALQMKATARASFYLYTTTQDIDVFVESLKNLAIKFA